GREALLCQLVTPHPPPGSHDIGPYLADRIGLLLVPPPALPGHGRGSYGSRSKLNKIKRLDEKSLEAHKISAYVETKRVSWDCGAGAITNRQHRERVVTKRDAVAGVREKIPSGRRLFFSACRH